MLTAPRFARLVLLLLLFCGSAPAGAEALRVSVTYAPEVADSFSGRVYLMLDRAGGREPRLGPSWFNTQPFFAVDVKGWTPEEPLVFDDAALAYPAPLSELEAGTYAVQAVLRRSLDSPTIGHGPGTAYSPARELALAGSDAKTIDLRISEVVEPRAPRQRENIHYVEVESALLSDFHRRPITMRAALIMPEGWEPGSEQRYPAYYWINGFGGDHTRAAWMARHWSDLPGSDRIVRVIPDPLCYGGHHVFADSANNGPRGRALVEELIPHLEKHWPLAADPSARFLGGHSSGGWSSLWLQVTYPKFFGGVWSVAPDPVDFRDFQRIDLYAPGANMYRDEQGEPRPLARSGDRVMALYEQFARMEVVHGEGGQLRSFEWVFSPRGEDGLPRPLYDRTTGAVDPVTAEAWKRYDIRLIIEQRWDELREPLAGKIHVFMGAEDTFYLEGATRLLKQSLERLGSDAVIEIVEGADHGSISTPALAERIDREMLGEVEK